MGVILHVLIIGSSGVCLISGDVEHGARRDGVVLVTDGVTGTDLGALGVEGNGDRATSLDTGSLASVVNDRLVVLQTSQLRSSSDVDGRC
jgi:hypothetical protein